MPTHDFNNIGEVLDFEILKGKITAIDSATDTCTVDVAGSSREALIFYHCKPDSIIRDNGAIEGGAGGFKVDDEVIVMINSDNSVIKVIGHTDGIRACGSFVVFVLAAGVKWAVLVWDAQKNSAHNWGTVENPLTVIDYDNADFQVWFEAHKNVGKNMFSDFLSDIERPILDGNQEPIPGEYYPHKLVPELIDTGYMDYHADHSASTLPVLFPETYYATVLLPPQPPEAAIIYAGLRTSAGLVSTGSQKDKFQLEWTDWELMKNGNGDIVLAPAAAGYEIGYWTPSGDWGQSDYPDAIWKVPRMDYSHYPNVAPPGVGIAWWMPLYQGYVYDNTVTDTFNFYGLLGLFNSFEAISTSSGWWGGWDLEKNTESFFIPDWMLLIDRTLGMTDDEWAVKNKGWYHSTIQGEYSDKIITDVSIVQYTPCKYTEILTMESNAVKTWTPQTRITAVQAQALYVPEGTTGYDWVAEGRNEELETQIIAAINMSYSLNNIPANEIRACSIGIKIMQ